MTERFDKGIHYTEFWDYALGDSPFSEEDIAELSKLMYDNHDTMPLDRPEPAVFVADIDFDDDLPF